MNDERAARASFSAEQRARYERIRRAEGNG